MNISVKKSVIGGCLTAAAIVCAVSCAKEASTTKNEANQRYLEAWMSVNHPEASASGLGIYVLDDKTGSGEVIGDEDYYVFTETTVTDLEGNVTSTSSRALAQQIGSFSQGNFYGSKVIVNHKAYSATGLFEMLKGMRVGGEKTAVVPGWLNVTQDYDTAEDYLKNCTGDDAIYNVKVTGKTTDILKWEVDTLEKYVAINMEKVDSTMYGYYYLQLKAPEDTTSLPTDTTIYINYTGRLLNGQVFDTTIKDTAKVYGIYSTSKTYEPQLVTLNETYTSITMGSSSNTDGSTGSTVVDGFAYCLSKLKRYERCVCAFYSQYGYGYSGSGNAIPSFSPLVFEIEMVDPAE